MVAAMFMGGVVAKASGQKFITGVKGAAVGAAAGMIGNAAGSYSKGYGSRLPGAADVGYEGDTPAIDNVMNLPEPPAAVDSVNVATPTGSDARSLPKSCRSRGF